MTALFLALTLVAHGGDGCDAAASGGLATGPARSGLLDGDLGRAHRVCGRNEVGLSGSGLATIDTPNFYGHLVGSVLVDGSVMATDRLEVFGALEWVRYDTVISALPVTSLGMGHTVVGASYRLADPDGTMAVPGLALNGKVVLPTAVGLYTHSYPLAADAGLAGLHGTGPWQLHWQLSLVSSLGLGPGPALPRLGLAPTIGGQWRPSDVFALVVDVQGTYAYTASVDHTAAALGLRLSDTRRWGLQLGASVPLVGRERALATADLRTTVRLGALPD